MKKITTEMIKKRKEKYMDSQRTCLLAADAERNFFKNAKAYASGEKPKEFDVRELFPDKNDREIAELIANHFNKVSNKVLPLEPSDIPSAHDREIPVLLPYQVAGRL